MSDRGSILISTANDIGEALVEKLGGEGYTPSVWDKEYNKLGIAEVDSAPALSVLENSSETGTARGSILLSTANAIGAMLNKKYNTDRGFKPKEWASAGRKMKALETDTKSGSIVNIQGAKETPLLSLVGTIDPTIEGTSEVNAYKLGKNLINANDESKTFSANVVTNYDVASLELKKGVTYTFSAKQNTAITGSTRNTLRITFGGNYTYESTASNYHNQAGVHSMSITPAQDGTAVFSIWTHTPAEDVTYSDFMVEVGSSASAYESYKAPTTYTADLGETIHGGKVDFIKGEVTDAITETKTFTGATSEVWQYSSAYGWFYIDNQFSDAYRNNQEKDFMACNLGTQQAYANVTVLPNMTFACTSGTNSRFVFKNTDYDNVDDFKAWLSSNNMVVAYLKSDFVPFSITPIEINTSGDVENYYTSAGDTSIEYYTVPTPYTRGTASGAIANVQSARTDLPFTKVKANIAPNLTGVESVEVTKCGVNLFDKAKATIGKYMNVSGQEATNEAKAHSALLPLKPSTTYYMSGHADNSYYSILALDKDMNVLSTWYGGASKTEAFTATTPNNARWCYLNFNADQIDTMMFAESSSPVSYVEYNENVYTADLGEPVHGGSVDFVSGEKTKTHKTLDMGSLTWSYHPASGSLSAYFDTYLPNDAKKGNNQVAFDGVSADYTSIPSSQIALSGHDDMVMALGNDTRRFFLCDQRYTSASDLVNALNGAILVYPLETPTESEMPERVISPSEGVNNLWNNAGGDTDVEYFEQE